MRYVGSSCIKMIHMTSSFISGRIRIYSSSKKIKKLRVFFFNKYRRAKNMTCIIYNEILCNCSITIYAK